MSGGVRASVLKASIVLEESSDSIDPYLRDEVGRDAMGWRWR
jgi:hypothetical protein